eukprot:7815643-Pyramimonas_sp.AAC.1
MLANFEQFAGSGARAPCAGGGGFGVGHRALLAASDKHSVDGDGSEAARAMNPGGLPHTKPPQRVNDYSRHSNRMQQDLIPNARVVRGLIGTMRSRLRTCMLLPSVATTTCPGPPTYAKQSERKL